MQDVILYSSPGLGGRGQMLALSLLHTKLIWGHNVRAVLIHTDSDTHIFPQDLPPCPPASTSPEFQKLRLFPSNIES